MKERIRFMLISVTLISIVAILIFCLFFLLGKNKAKSFEGTFVQRERCVGGGISLEG